MRTRHYQWAVVAEGAAGRQESICHCGQQQRQHGYPQQHSSRA